MSSRFVLFEGRQLERRSIGRIFRRGPALLAEVDGRNQTIHEYTDIREAEAGRRYLLMKLNRRHTWI